MLVMEVVEQAVDAERVAVPGHLEPTAHALWKLTPLAWWMISVVLMNYGGRK
jgi:hypothetical protein